MKRASLAGAIALVLAGAASPGAALSADMTALRGQRPFLRCASCHDVAPSTLTKIGPNLHGVVGRKAGALPGYGYSPALKAAGFVWTDAMLDRWLTDPNALVPGTAMAFAGLPDAKDRAAIIAYLKKN